jgi:hypothetical protein
MHPWMAEQANREHIAQLRSLSRPFGMSLVGLRAGRRWVTWAQPRRLRQAVSDRRRRLSVRF